MSGVVTFDERAQLLAKLLAQDAGDGEFWLGHLDAAVEYLTAAGVPALLADLDEAKRNTARLVAARKRAFARTNQILGGVKAIIADRDQAVARATIQILAMERAHAALDRDPGLPEPAEPAAQILEEALEFERHSR